MRRRLILRLMAAILILLVVLHKASRYSVTKITETMSPTAGNTHRAHLQQHETAAQVQTMSNLREHAKNAAHTPSRNSIKTKSSNAAEIYWAHLQQIETAT